MALEKMLEGTLFCMLAEGLFSAKQAMLLMHALPLQVWVKPQVREGKIYWLADSDSALTKVMLWVLHLLLNTPAVCVPAVCAVPCARAGCLAARHQIPCCRWS